MELIDKAAVVAEIKKIYNEDYKFLPSDLVESVGDFKDDLLVALDTFEVKDMEESNEDKHWQDVRERAAIAAMQGILCSPVVEGIDPNPSQKSVAKLAVMQADTLIEELKKGGGK